MPAPLVGVWMTRLTFLSVLGFLSGFFFSQPQARVLYPISPLLLPPLSMLLVLGPRPTLGDILVTVCPGHPKNNLHLPCPGVGIPVFIIFALLQFFALS